MKNKFLCCFLMLVMIAGLFVCPASALTGDIIVDVALPVSNPSNLTVSDSGVTFTAKGQYVEYEVDVPEAGSYYVNFNRANTVSGQNFYIYVMVNDETVNRRTGRISNSDGSYTFQDEVLLAEGINIIRVGNMSNAGGIVSALSLTRLENMQHTTSMNSHSGGRNFIASYKQGLGVDPWLWINDNVASYPEGDTAPFITFEVTIPKAGYYYPAVATSGADKIKLSIADESFAINDNCTTLSESYKASGSASCSWIRSNDIVYLEEGSHNVTISLYAAAGQKWNTFIGAVRFIEYEEAEQPKITVYDSDFTLDVTKSPRNNGVQVLEDSILISSGGWAEYDVYVSEDASYYVNFRRQNEQEGKNFYIEINANGETINRRTGRTSNSDGSYTFQDEIQLQEGKNVIKVSAMGSNSGIVEWLSFTKLGKRQFTTSMNTKNGAREFKAAYMSGIGVDPWVYISEPVSKYAPNDAPYITFDVEILNDGYYYPELARGGITYAKMYVDGQSFDMHGNAEELDEKYISSGSATCSWKRSNDAVFLTQGTHEVTVKAVGGLYAEDAIWRLSVGAVRFTEAPEQHTSITVEGEDARIFLGESKTPAEFDSNGISLVLSDDSDALAMSGASVAAIQVPTSDLPVELVFDVVVNKASDYNIEILKAHNVSELSDGMLSITLDSGEKVIEDVILDDTNVTETRTDYLKLADFGNNGLDVVKLNESVHLPTGTHKMTILASAEDLDVGGNMVSMFIDAVRFCEKVNLSGVDATLSDNKVCVGKTVKVIFENEDGLPVYTNSFKTVSFSTSDKAIATINSEGIIRGMRPGNVTITAVVNGKDFTLPMSVTMQGGLIIKSANLDDDGNINITYSANRGEKFDIVVANYDVTDGKKTSIRGVFDTKSVTARGEEEIVVISKPSDTTGFGSLYEIYMWEKEASLIPVYQKIQIQ